MSIRLATAVLTATIALVAPTFAQDRFPSQPLRVLVPSAAGGGTDATFRMLGEIAEKELGQPVIIMNRPGASGSIAATALMQSKPDGYTVAGIWGDVVTVVPHTLRVGYTPADFVPVSLSATVPLVFCVKPNFPANSGAEFLAALKAKPDTYTYGTDGNGGAVHLAAENIFTHQGIKARMIPFSDSATIFRNFMGGVVDIYGGATGIVAPYVKSGDVKCLLLSSPDRNPAMPQASGLSELKLENASTVVWRGIIAPKGIPSDRLRVLESAFNKAATSERFKEFMIKQGGTAVGASSGDLQALMQRDYLAFDGLVKHLGLAK